jgi:formate C-acetyltransferase
MDTLGLLREEMDQHYRAYRRDVFETRASMLRVRDDIWAAMDAFIQAHPDSPAWTLKAQLHQEIAERFEPVLFPHTPFYFEMGLRPAENWGTPHGGLAAEWLLRRRRHIAFTHPDYDNVRYFGFQGSPLGVAQEHVFDDDHHSLGMTKLLAVGVQGLLSEIAARRNHPATAAQISFLDAAEMSCCAVLRVADRFADHAERQINRAPDAVAAAFLTRIAETARRIPAEPPRTFYEGLAALWFLREVAATLEGVGISVIGHPDRQLIDLYRADLAEGRLTEDAARDLLARWLLPTDVKFFVKERSWPETSTCIELGGCDVDGDVVFNELTKLIMEVHAELGLLNPKLQCRFSHDSPQAYLDLLSEHVVGGRNAFSMLNDDVLIPACMRSGKSAREARLYVNGGCQETIVEGVEHSAGAYYYFSMPRVLDLCLQPAPPVPDVEAPEAPVKVPEPIEGALDFETFYRLFMDALKETMAVGAKWRRHAAGRWTEIHPAPFFSATLKGCIEDGRDYTAGGAVHNASGIALVGLATLIDSLYAIRRAVFEEAWLSLVELREVLAHNWQTVPSLRARMVGLPKFGHGDKEVDALASRFAKELADFIRTLRNERGGAFQPSFFVYYQFVGMGRYVRATPDGRYDGDLLSQGVGPSHLRGPDSLTDIFRSFSRIDLRDYPANAVLDVQLPMGSALPEGVLPAVMRTFARMGGATFQPNVVSVGQMREAQLHPERHEDLVVRVCGLSARFVALEREVQDEIIARHSYA